MPAHLQAFRPAITPPDPYMCRILSHLEERDPRTKNLCSIPPPEMIQILSVFGVEIDQGSEISAGDMPATPATPCYGDPPICTIPIADR